ncbi:two-component system LytT family sensor kinase [Sphingomonas sp. UYAg733]
MPAAPPSPDEPDDTAPAVVPVRIVMLSILCFWAFYFAISTARALMGGEPGQLLRFVPRTIVSVISMAATAVIYLLLRRIATALLARSIAVAALLSVPAAAIYGTANWYMFDRFLPYLTRTAVAAVPAVESSSSAIVVGAAKMSEAPSAPIVDIVGTALSGYFFFVGWCALYLALSYAGQVGALERRAARLSAAAQSAELRALRYQVNPHFLFNTLNSLSSLVLSERTAAAERMIIGLSTFFRASLTGDPTQDVALREEIMLQRLYLDMEAVRFGDRLRVTIDVPVSLETACVPGLILQPLVENAIKHAVSRTRRPVTIGIVAEELHGRLVLRVQDDGSAASGEVEHGRIGVGLANVRDRIAARFGTDGTAAWGAIAGGGYAVTLEMPLSRDGC